MHARMPSACDCDRQLSHQYTIPLVAGLPLCSPKWCPSPMWLHNALHKMSPAAGCTKITDSDGAGAFKASHSSSNGGWHLKNHFRIVTSSQNWRPPSNIPLLPPLPNAPSVPFYFPFCFSLVLCDALARHTPFKDSFDSRPGASRSCGRPVPAQLSSA